MARNTPISLDEIAKAHRTLNAAVTEAYQRLLVKNDYDGANELGESGRAVDRLVTYLFSLSSGVDMVLGGKATETEEEEG